ncbi:MAG: aminoacylase [Candidatus Binatia bacterium]|nr:MAG: aminoacylase [Candidatus Binatia bacterium]
MPGFIDIHSHADWLLVSEDHGELLEPFVRQGITTIVGGNCGFSPAPLTERNRAAAQDASRLIRDEEIELRWQTMQEFLELLSRQGVALNVAELVGHGTVRAAVTGPLDPRVPGREELREMESLVRESLDAGCVGVSTGLGYPPGIFAGADELVECARWAAQSGKLFTSHLKAYSWISGVYDADPHELPHNLAALEEVLSASDRAGARVQVSHLIFVGRRTWPYYRTTLQRIEEYRSRGLDVAFDAFPYTAGNTTASVLFPPNILPRLEEVLESPSERKALGELARAVFSELGLDLGDIQIMKSNAPRFEKYNGLRVTEAAEREGMDPFEFYARLVVESRRMARVLIHTYSGDERDETALRAVLSHPLCLVETDTFVTRSGHQNPASYGTFPRVLGRYVAEGLFSFEEAVRKSTGGAAERLGWKDRGWVRPGCAADLVVVDREKLRDRATFENPAEPPEGIEYVFVNGKPVLFEGRYDPGARAGQVLRH